MKKILFSFCFSLIALFSFSETIIVQNTNNSGTGSLRDAVNNALSGDTIRFNPNLISGGSNTIVLNSELNFVKNLVFKGLYNANDTLYISGNNSNRIFYVDFTSSPIANKTITLDSLALIRGAAAGNGGAIFFKHGDSLVINNSLLYRNAASSAGGAIFVDVLSAASLSSIVTITNSTISENTANTSGGGIYSNSNSNTNSSVLTVSNCRIIGNTANNGSGGGIFSKSNSNTANFSTVTAINSTISENNASSGFGGGIYSMANSNASNAASTVRVSNCTINRNSASVSGGGGIYSKSTIIDYNSNASSVSSVLVDQCDISENEGSGIFSTSSSGDYYATSASSIVTVKKSTINGNTSTAGGGIASTATAVYTGFSIYSTITLDSTTIEGNTTEAAGGGVYSNSSAHSTVTANYCTISDNSSSYYGGGGIYSNGEYASVVNLGNSTISENTAIPFGGGIYSNSHYATYNFGSNSSVNLNKCTLFGNSATESGGGIFSKSYFNTSEVTLENSTIYGNTAGTDGEGVYTHAPISKIIPTSCIIAHNGASNLYNNSINSTIISLGYNLFSNAPSGYNVSNDQVNVNSTSLNLLPLSYDGGYTKTMRPGIGSLAIDLGNPSDLTDAQNIAIEGIRDVGAAEYNCKSYASIDLLTCETYTWPINGQTYFNDTIITDTLVAQNVNGCDSIVTLNLTVEDLATPVADLASLPAITSQCQVEFITAPTATDNCAGLITGTTDIEFPINASGTTIITWTFDDGNGNTSTQTQQVIIDDVTAPTPDMTNLPNLTAECDITALAPTATDNCAGSITGTADVAFPITTSGTTIVTWTYDDGNGNTSTQSQTVIIQDVTAPTPDMTNLPNLTSECELTALAPTATDNCAGIITGTADVTFPITASGPTIIIWTYDDGNGNTSSQTQTVIITPIDNGITQLDEFSFIADASGYTYQWLDCDNGNSPISGATNQVFTPTVAGNYACEITNGTCSVTTACLTNTLGILENSFGNSIVVYPNPTTGNIRVELGDLKTATRVKLINALGQVVMTKSFGAADEIQLNIEESSGLYILEVQSEDGKIARIVVIKE
jgi:predicted outer membrane repeat protein